MEPSEIEFFGEKEDITIVPNFSESKIFLISVSFHYKIDSVIIIIVCRVSMVLSILPCTPRFHSGWLST